MNQPLSLTHPPPPPSLAPPFSLCLSLAVPSMSVLLSSQACLLASSSQVSVLASGQVSVLISWPVRTTLFIFCFSCPLKLIRLAQAWGTSANVTFTTSTSPSSRAYLVELSSDDSSRADLGVIDHVLFLAAFRPPLSPVLVSCRPDACTPVTSTGVC